MPPYGVQLKVIFLDFDGVLNSHEWSRRRPPGTHDDKRLMLDPAAVGLVNQLIRRTGARVVISSTWRLFPEHAAQRVLNLCGFTGDVIGQTPDGAQVRASGLFAAKCRGGEIQCWLDEYQAGGGAYIETGGNKIESFVILDDDSDMAHLSDRLVKTAYTTGITQADVDRAVVMLGGPPLRDF